jgi:phosphohistidine phosphatase
LKSLLLIRHAKSDWNSPAQSDFERPLNERGKKDAPVMAHRLLAKKITIDAFVSSPAKRARKTATIFAKELDRNKHEILFKEELYAAPEELLYEVVQGLNDNWNSVAIFSHNPGITDFANSLTDTRIDNIPTCGIFAVKIHADHWTDFAKAQKEFWFADYPKAGAE